VLVLRGPFRGARVVLSPRHSLRQIFGLYEHELNDWITSALPHVDKVLDVGASQGYFAFGCAAAFRRLKKPAEIHVFEPELIPELESSLKNQPSSPPIYLHRTWVGGVDDKSTITLDSFTTHVEPRNALIKIDVEGMEVEVINSAAQWLNSTNRFLIEVHWHEDYITSLQDTFGRYGLKLDLINQAPLPIIGRENRAANCWWLVSSPDL
jgi:hypothetical protein